MTSLFNFKLNSVKRTGLKWKPKPIPTTFESQQEKTLESSNELSQEQRHILSSYAHEFSALIHTFYQTLNLSLVTLFKAMELLDQYINKIQPDKTFHSSFSPIARKNVS